MAKETLSKKSYADALAFARGLHAPGKPLDLPDFMEYARLVAEDADIDVDAFDPDENIFHELPEAYELAYLTVRLERLKAKIKKERGIDVSGL